MILIRRSNPIDVGLTKRQLLHWLQLSVIVNSFNPTQRSLLLLVSLAVAASTFLFVHRILAPWADAKDLQKGGLKAQMGDLYPRWVGARELLLHGRDPYGPEVTQQIQLAYYGHMVTPEESRRRVVDEQRFAYPVYVVFLMAPTIRTDFSHVYFWAPFALGGLAVIGVFACIGLLDWKLSWSVAVGLVLLVVSSPQIVQGMRHQQLAIVVGCLLFAGAWCVHRGHLAISGAFLALSTIKPQIALLPLAWFAIWVAGGWRTRYRILLSFALTLGILTAAGEYLCPGWVREFVSGMAAYRHYFPTTSILRLLLGDWVGIAVAVVIVACVLVFAWTEREIDPRSSDFASVFSVFLMATIVCFPLFTPFNQILLVLPALLVVRDWDRMPRLPKVLFLMAICWPWVTSAVLLLLRITPDPNRMLPLIPSFAVSAVPLLLPVILFWRKERLQPGPAS